MPAMRHCATASSLVLLCLLACDRSQPVGPSATPAAAVMLGTWSYAAPPPLPTEMPSLNTGLHVTLMVHAAEGSTFRGAVGAWFVGDVGLPPGTFGPVEGTVEAGGRVTVVIPIQRTGVPPLTLAGRVAGDTIIVVRSQLGVEPGPFPPGAVFARRSAP